MCCLYKSPKLLGQICLWLGGSQPSKNGGSRVSVHPSVTVPSPFAGWKNRAGLLKSHFRLWLTLEIESKNPS